VTVLVAHLVVAVVLRTTYVCETLLLGLLRLVTRLCTCTAWDVRLLAIRVPTTTRHSGVIETNRVAKCVELLLRQLTRITDTQPVKRQSSEGDALQLVDVEPERLDHSVDLAMLALVDRDGEPRVLALAWEHFDVGRHRYRAVVELDTIP
jgi:hypothetical protein